MLIHDFIGIGFGPSNIALAIAVDEARDTGQPLEHLFIERQPSFMWHPDMLLEQSHMQISFLKDLVMLRNPTSRFTFVNYLHERRRLQDFINLQSFFPSRHEFTDYFSWAAAQFQDRCAYGEEVFDVLPERRGGEVVLLRVRSRDQTGEHKERLARNLVVSIGGAMRIPDCFKSCANEPRVFHSSNYLRGIADNADARRIAVIGAGQSAAEIFMDLHGRASAPQVDLVIRGSALKPADGSPYVNEIFNADRVDHMFSRSAAERAELLREYRHTNYASPDEDLVQQIFKLFYEQKVRGDTRHRFLRRHEVRSVSIANDGMHLTLHDLDDERASIERYDAVVLATGYERGQHRSMLQSLASHLGSFEIDRNYRIKTPEDFHPAIFVQGASEPTHGISDTLLSVTAVRTGEIGRDLLATMQAQQHRRVALNTV